MWWGYKAAGKFIGGSAKMGARVGSNWAGGTAGPTFGGGARNAARGYLAPGDPTPPPTASTDYLDYRGVATWPEAAPLQGQPFSLGTFMDLRKPRNVPAIGLPQQVLNRHAMVVGPNGSGKTAGVVLPWIHAALSCGWSVVAVDVKGDLREDFLAYRDAFGAIPGARLRKWDFTDPQRSTSWQWLAELTDDARVDAAVTALIGRKPEGGTQDPYFYQRDYRTLRGLLKFVPAVASTGATFGDLVRLLQTKTALEQLLARHPRAPGAADLGAVVGFSAADYAKVISGVVTALAMLDVPAIERVTSDSRLLLEDALDEHHFLIIGAPKKGGEVSVTLSSLLLNQLKQRLYERFGGHRRPVLFVIDEAPQLAKRVDIAELMAVGRSAGVGVVVALQDLAQFKDADERNEIEANATTLVVLPGAGATTVESVVKRLGQRHERTFNLTTAPQPNGWGNQRTTGFGTEVVPVLREREIMQVPFGTRPALVHVKDGGVTPKPMVVDLYYESGG